MPKNKPRYLRLSLKTSVPAGVSDKKIMQTLLDSIQRGDYEYPRGWRVALGWSNKEMSPLRWGEWTKEMKASAESSPGWDIAVASYLEKQLEKLEQ